VKELQTPTNGTSIWSRLPSHHLDEYLDEELRATGIQGTTIIEIERIKTRMSKVIQLQNDQNSNITSTATDYLNKK
jgi:hypothetical protein